MRITKLINRLELNRGTSARTATRRLRYSLKWLRLFRSSVWCEHVRRWCMTCVPMQRVQTLSCGVGSGLTRACARFDLLLACQPECKQGEKFTYDKNSTAWDAAADCKFRLHHTVDRAQRASLLPRPACLRSSNHVAGMQVEILCRCPCCVTKLVLL